MRSTLVCLFAGFLVSLGVGQAQPPVDDPIFGMHYDAGRIHFEKASSLRAQCPALWSKIPKNEVFYIFADAKVDGKEYIIVSSKTTEVSGAGLIIKGSKCAESTPERLLGDSTPGNPNDEVLPEAAVKAVVSDALRRYSQAFGGKLNLLEALRKFGLRSEDLPKGLREEMAVFSREP